MEYRTDTFTERDDYYQSRYDSYQGPPVPPPWVPRYDSNNRRWYYFNERSSESSWELPRGEYRGEYREEVVQENTYYEQPQKKDHRLLYGAGGVAAGLLAGAVVTHEADKIHNRFEDDKYKFEDDKYRLEQGVEDFPDDAAEWAGEKVGKAEYRVDEFKDDVEDFPDDAANWVGRKVGAVDDFKDNIEESYDDGRDQGQDDYDDEGW